MLFQPVAVTVRPLAVKVWPPQERAATVSAVTYFSPTAHSSRAAIRDSTAFSPAGSAARSAPGMEGVGIMA